MGTIAEMLQQKMSISADMAQRAEQLVIEHIASRVPAQFQGVLNSALGSGTPHNESSAAEGASPAEGGGLGGLLGGARGFLNKK
jgi:hypothetical protein